VSAFLRHKYSLPAGWLGYKFQAIEPLRRSPGILVTGAVTPPKQRGKYAGKPNWRAKDKATVQTLLLLNAEFEAWDQPHLYAPFTSPPRRPDMSETRCPYRAIMIAADRGRGVHLTAHEVFQMAGDNAIATVALNSLTPAEWERMEKTPARPWLKLSVFPTPPHGEEG
jgi:hypothetical protein